MKDKSANDVMAGIKEQSEMNGYQNINNKREVWRAIIALVRKIHST